MSELTEEQRRRIEVNKRIALERRALLDTQRAIVTPACPIESHHCECVIADDGSICGSDEIIKEIFETFGEKVCRSCRSSSDDYTLINRSDALSRYLVSAETLKILKFETKVNPTNSYYAPMKLYLLKHVRRCSFQRWGDEEGLLRELERREKEKFERGLEKCHDTFVLKKRSREEDSGDVVDDEEEKSIISASLKSTPGSSSDSKRSDTRNSSLPSEPTAARLTGEPKVQKTVGVSGLTGKRGAQLNKMLSAIRGKR
jgi:DNA repair protein